MRHFNFTFLSVLLTAILTFPTLSHADVIFAKDTVTGTVIGRDKEPLPGAKVEIVGQPYYVYTDFDGRFNIKCERGAKKVLVSYPKLRDVKKKISRDMTVRIGRSWKQVPENYQSFIGACIGIGITGAYYDRMDYNDWNGYYSYEHHNTFVAPNISVMMGRVKAVGWYLKGFLTCAAQGNDNDFYDETIKAKSAGVILGGMVRLGCPLHFYLGGGVGYTNLSADMIDFDSYNKTSWQIDMGLLFRIKDNYGINMSWNVGNAGNADITLGSVLNLGFLYFFNR